MEVWSLGTVVAAFDGTVGGLEGSFESDGSDKRLRCRHLRTEDSRPREFRAFTVAPGGTGPSASALGQQGSGSCTSAPANRKKRDAWQKAGKKFWWYWACQPTEPWLNPSFIEWPAIHGRLFFWLMALENVRSGFRRILLILYHHFGPRIYLWFSSRTFSVILLSCFACLG